MPSTCLVELTFTSNLRLFEQSVKDFYDCCSLSSPPQPSCCRTSGNGSRIYNETFYDSLVSEIVRRFKDHPALYGWYLNDEYHRAMVPLLARRFEQIVQLDGKHVTYSVTNLLNSPDLTIFENTSHIFGVDPYPWHNSSTADLSWEAENALALSSAVGSIPTRSIINLAQAFDWANRAKCAAGIIKFCNSSFPSDAALRAMAFLHPVLGSDGVMIYSYLGLYGCGYPLSVFDTSLLVCMCLVELMSRSRLL